MWRNRKRAAGSGGGAVPRLVIILFIITLLCSALLIANNWYTLTYFFRPVWDTPPPPFTFVPHFYSPNLTITQLCNLHNWQPRPEPRRVYDAVIFNNELDLLEIRWRELDPLITKFLLIESNGTFTGHPKPLWFQSAPPPIFNFTKSKLGYRAIQTPGLAPGQDPFEIEKLQRQQMNQLIQESGVRDGDLLIMSDTDEIPSFNTIQLLRSCDGFPSPMHLQMKNFLYSFDFFVDRESWRSTVHRYDPGASWYGHSRRSDMILADAGWHCSFCLRKISDIVFKMKSYSHAERVRRREFLNPDRIQKLICSGRDLYDMLPEEYSYRKLIAKMGEVPRTHSAVNLPSHLLSNADRFNFLLPGNCVREE